MMAAAAMNKQGIAWAAPAQPMSAIVLACFALSSSKSHSPPHSLYHVSMAACQPTGQSAGAVHLERLHLRECATPSVVIIFATQASEAALQSSDGVHALACVATVHTPDTHHVDGFQGGLWHERGETNDIGHKDTVPRLK